MPGIQALGNSWIGSDDFAEIFQRGEFECALVDNARLIFGGCSSGHGCIGRLFMAQAARNLAPNKKIQIQAGDDTSTKWLSGITSKTGSLNGRDIHLDYQAGNEHWEGRGIRGQSIPSVASVCLSEWEGTSADLGNVIDEIAVNRCVLADGRRLEKGSHPLQKDSLDEMIARAKEYRGTDNSTKFFKYMHDRTINTVWEISGLGEDLLDSLRKQRKACKRTMTLK